MLLLPPVADAMAMKMELGLALFAAMVFGVAAWGKDGHHITCLIAQPLLSSEAQDAIEKLLPHGNFVDLCSWADDVKRSYRFRWSGPLHYIDTPDHLCTYDYDRDCHNAHGEKDMCVSGAINNYTSQLETYKFSSSRFATRFLSLKGLSSYNLTEALLFLAHYVGDIHQPLHVGFTTDAGGNSIHVHWYRRKYNLHHIWDTEFIESAKRLYYHDISKMAHNISRSVTKEDASAWGSCDENQAACTDSYAVESIHAACKWAYKDASENTYLEDEYFLSRLPIVEQRLAQGGVRLASILNRIFSGRSLRLHHTS